MYKWDTWCFSVFDFVTSNDIIGLFSITIAITSQALERRLTYIPVHSIYIGIANGVALQANENSLTSIVKLSINSTLHTK